MSLILKSDIDDMFNIMTSRNFVSKVFICDKTDIKKENGTMFFDTVFTSSDLHAIENVKLPAFFGDHFDGYKVSLITTHYVIKHEKDCFIIKYTSVLNENDILYKLLGKTMIVLYVSIHVNPIDESLLTCHMNRKLLRYDGIDDDSLIINTKANDIMNNIFQHDKVEINENIINVTETLFGKDIVQNSILPFINSLYNTLFDIIIDQYKFQFIKYFTKKKIEIYKKK